VFATLKTDWRKEVSSMGPSFGLGDVVALFLPLWFAFVLRNRAKILHSWAKRGYTHNPDTFDLTVNLTLRTSGQADYLIRKRRLETLNGLPKTIEIKEKELAAIREKLSKGGGARKVKSLTEKQADLTKDITKKREYLESTKKIVEQERAAGISYDFDTPVTDLQKAMRDHTAQLALARSRSQVTSKSAIETIEFQSEDGTRVKTNKGLRATDELYDACDQRAAKKQKKENSRAERRKANNEDVPSAFKNGRLKYKTAKMLEDYFTEQVGIEVKGKKLAELRELAVSHFRKQGIVPAPAPEEEPGPADERPVPAQQTSPATTQSSARVIRTASGGPFGCS
jgi:hypothetical protein